MIEYEVLETLPFGRQLIRILAGAHAGSELVLAESAPNTVGRLADYLGDEAVPGDGRVLPVVAAERLLCSLLNREQLADWKSDRRFWVATAFGRVQLGRLFELRFRPWRGPTLLLCVVPTGFDSLPDQDIWTNLLLALHGDPDWFFKVANWRRLRGEWMWGPVPTSFLIRRGGAKPLPNSVAGQVARRPLQLALF